VMHFSSVPPRPLKLNAPPECEWQATGKRRKIEIAGWNIACVCK
jgi:hypothetical protein